MSISVVWRSPRNVFCGIAVFALTTLAPFSTMLRIEEQRPAQDAESAATTVSAVDLNSVAEIASGDAARLALVAIYAETVAIPPPPAATTEQSADAIAAEAVPDEAPTAEAASEIAGGEAETTGQPEVSVEKAPSPPAPILLPPAKPSTAALAWGAKVSLEFREKVIAMCGRLGCQPNDMMAAMAFESVETFSPSVRNPTSGAVGLIQFMEDTAHHLGTSQDSLAEMTPEEQLAYVEKYFQPFKGKLSTLEDVYMAILWPRAVGQPNDFVLFSDGSIQYKQNATLDTDQDGDITKEETAALVNAMLRKGLRPQNVD